MAQTMLAFTIVAVLMVSQGVSAKRGCSAFGHSCFGGHGKRSGDTSMEVSGPEMMARHQMGQEETPPHPGYPHTYNNILQPGDDIIPIRDGGAYDRDDAAAARDVMKLKLRNIFKQWVQDNYRRSQQSPDDSYFNENM